MFGDKNGFINLVQTAYHTVLQCENSVLLKGFKPYGRRWLYNPEKVSKGCNYEVLSY